MAYLIGTDEAGYGPNLGPLTVTGTLWRVPAVDTDLYQSLKDAVVADRPRRASSKGGAATAKLHVADSKAVYQSSGSIASLERSVLAMLFALRGEVPADERQLLASVFSKCVEDRIALFTREPALWQSGDPIPLPLKCQADDVRAAGQNLSDCADRSRVMLMDVLCRPLFPAAFNLSLDRLENKANVLSSHTMSIVQSLLRQLPQASDERAGSQDLLIGCDKHGGRSRYLGLIQQFLTDRPVTIECEGRELSRYHWHDGRRAITIQFAAKGESFLPIAAASMVSKFVREVFMDVWNDFWNERVDNLRPTKGYPADAKRFMADIESARAKLGIAPPSIWRRK